MRHAIRGSFDLWISNGLKDAFCDVLTTVATLEGHDIMAIYKEAAGVAGTYGVSGLGIDLEELHHYLGGPEGVGATSMSAARDWMKLPSHAACRPSNPGTWRMYSHGRRT